MVLLALLFPFQSGAQTAGPVIPLGYGPYAMALNPVTNKIYVSTSGSIATPETTVDVIDANSWKITNTITVGDAPCAIGVNPLTNKIYVANCNSVNQGGTVSVIDGATDVISSTVTIGGEPYSSNSVNSVSLAVNPVTDKIYVAQANGTVTVIDGATDTVSATVTVPPLPYGIAVNPVANLIYVGSEWPGNGVTSGSVITVIDGATNQVTEVPIPDDSALILKGNVTVIAVNSVTDQVYLALGPNYVIDLDGTTNQVTPITIPVFPNSTAAATALAVDPVTNKVYIGYIDNALSSNTAYDTNEIVEIDGGTNVATLIPTGLWPAAVGVNPLTNQIYTANVIFPDGANYIGDGTVSVINGATHASVALPAPATFNGFGSLLTVNPITNRAYILNPGFPNPAPPFSPPAAAGTIQSVDGTTNNTATVSAGSDPFVVAVDPNLNKAYVANDGSNDITVIDGATNTTTSIPVGTNPFAIAVDPITGKAFVVNQGDNDITVIDGVTDSIAATVPVGTAPDAVDVNPVTGTVYVANSGSNTVTAITEATNAAVTIPAGSSPVALAVNPATNRIYVADQGSNAVTVIDGVTNATSSVQVGDSPVAVAADPATNEIYVADMGANDVTVIDGATSKTSSVTVGTTPIAIAINPVTNKIYVANQDSDNVSIIDGTNNAATPVAVGSLPRALAVNLASNKVYVADSGSNDVMLINGVDNSTGVYPGGNGPVSVAINPITSKVYVADIADQATVLTEQATQPTPLVTKITPFKGNTTTGAIPTFTFTTSSTYAPTAPPVLTVFYQVDTLQGPWLAASGSEPSFTGQTQPLTIGTHILYAYALDAQANFNVSAFVYSSAQNITGSLTAYEFALLPPSTQTTLISGNNPSQVGDTVNFTAMVVPAPPGADTPTGSVDFFDGTTLLGSVALDANSDAVFATSALTAGTHQITAKYEGDPTFAASTSAVLTQTVNEDFSVSANPSTLTITAGQSGTSTLTVMPSGGSDTAPISFSCTGLPAGSACTFSPATVTPGANPATTTLTIQIAGAAVAAQPSDGPAMPPPTTLLLMLALVAVFGVETKLWKQGDPHWKWAPTICLSAVLGLATLMSACGGGAATTNPAQTTGSFIVAVHATAGSVDKTTTIALTVN